VLPIMFFPEYAANHVFPQNVLLIMFSSPECAPNHIFP
jgi:hypothetical protein